MKKIFLGILLLVLVFISVFAVNYLTFRSKQISVDQVDKFSLKDGFEDRLREAISIPTVSFENSIGMDSSAFFSFNQFLDDRYPLIDSLLKKSTLNSFSRVYKWEGQNRNLNPIILLGHLDVVPVPEENLDKWTYPPFAAKLEQGRIWGRGAIDDKNAVVGLMEAVENLLLRGVQPQRTVYLCFGHDEEISGKYGAEAIVEYLFSEDVVAEYILDEGYAITSGLIPGISKEVALIGTSEKGFATINLSVSLEGGHSSMPKPETAIDVLASAVTRVKQNPFPPRLSAPLKDFMSVAGPEMTFIQKLAFANHWFFESMIFDIYSNKSSGNALIRTTTSPTIFRAGIKENVIPYEANAMINFRILPGTTTNDVMDRVREIVDDERIQLTFSGFKSEAPKTSSIESFGYTIIEKSIKEVYENTVVAPNLVIAATDSRHYYPISQNIYRFAPFKLSEENIDTFHGINESIGVLEFEESIQFYIRLIMNSCFVK
jgi:carboxypeptidase PM20D1